MQCLTSCTVKLQAFPSQRLLAAVRRASYDSQCDRPLVTTYLLPRTLFRSVQTSSRASNEDLTHAVNDDQYLPFDQTSTAGRPDGVPGRTLFLSMARRNGHKGEPKPRSSQAPRSKHRMESSRQNSPATTREAWQIQKDALKTKFRTEGWAPKKRLSPDALDGIRALHAQFPDKYTTPMLAEQFQVSPEAIRRILKSKWRPNDEETASRRARWDKRGERIWSKMVALGVKPPKKWREVNTDSSHCYGLSLLSSIVPPRYPGTTATPLLLTVIDEC